MSLWNKWFNKTSNDYVYLREAFENHHHTAREDLHRNHPHATGILARYGVDLKKLRKRAAAVVAAAAVAGILLARPHGIGAPVEDQKQETSHTQLASTSENAEFASVQKKAPGGKLTTKPVISPDQDTDKDDGAKDKKVKKHKHKKGRSHLAPPKRHGLHDLGLHKGDKNAPHPIKNVKGGSVPNGIVITDKFEDMNPS